MKSRSIMDLICELAEVRGDTPLIEIPGCWEVGNKDKGWYLAANAHRVLNKCSAGVEVQPFNFYVQWNGFPAGVFDPINGGIIAAGDLANEETFCQWLEEEIENARRTL